MIARRSLLKIFGAAPLAAADPAGAARLAGIGNIFGSITKVPLASDHLQQPNTVDSLDQKKLTVLNLAGLPDFVKEGLKLDRRVPNGLDPDLAVNRSFSLAAKVAIQRQRDYERACGDTIRKTQNDVKRAAVRKITGLDWWW